MFDPHVGDLICARYRNKICVHKHRYLDYQHSNTAGYADLDNVYIVSDIDGEYGHTIHIHGTTLCGWTDAYDWKKIG